MRKGAESVSVRSRQRRVSLSTTIKPFKIRHSATGFNGLEALESAIILSLGMFRKYRRQGLREITEVLHRELQKQRKLYHSRAGYGSIAV